MLIFVNPSKREKKDKALGDLINICLLINCDGMYLKWLCDWLNSFHNFLSPKCCIKAVTKVKVKFGSGLKLPLFGSTKSSQKQQTDHIIGKFSSLFVLSVFSVPASLKFDTERDDKLTGEWYWIYCWYCGWKLWIASFIMSLGLTVSLRLFEILFIVTEWRLWSNSPSR